MFDLNMILFSFLLVIGQLQMLNFVKLLMCSVLPFWIRVKRDEN